MKTQITLPPGEYVIGDVCYLKQGQDIFDAINFFDEMGPAFTGTFQGSQVFVALTRYGDGGFKDNEGREYSVDGGNIGIVPLDKATPNLDWFPQHIITFDEPFVCSRSNDRDQGVITFGHIKIRT